MNAQLQVKIPVTLLPHRHYCSSLDSIRGSLSVTYHLENPQWIPNLLKLICALVFHVYILLPIAISFRYLSRIFLERSIGKGDLCNISVSKQGLEARNLDGMNGHQGYNQ